MMLSHHINTTHHGYTIHLTYITHTDYYDYHKIMVTGSLHREQKTITTNNGKYVKFVI